MRCIWGFRANPSIQEIETWVTALGHYDNNEFDEALKDFENIADTSKILFNMGVIHATLGEHEKAVSIGHNILLLAGTNALLGRGIPTCH